jgi:branched-chain amino acid transport system substrate-binding protein
VALTGFFSAYDLPQNRMMSFAVADYNKRGGVLNRPFKLIYANTNSDINRGTNAALELINKGADFITTSPDYDFGRAAAITAQQRGKLVLAGAGSAKFGVQGIGPLAFNVGIATNSEGAVMAEFAYRQQKYRSVYILLDDTIEYNKQTCKHFKQRWTQLAGAGSVRGEDVFKNADPSIASQITRLRSASSEPDFVVICSYNPGAASAVRQVRAAGLDLPIVMSASMDGAYWLEATPNLSNFYYVAYASLFGDDPNPKVNELVRRFRAAEGKAPSQSTCFIGYSQIQVLAEGVRRAKSTDSKRVARALETLKNFPTVLGPITYTKNLHFTVKRPLRVMKIVNGKQSYVKLWMPTRVPPVSFN